MQSYLVDAYAWNAVCRVIEKNTDKSITDSTTWGNYWNNKTTDYSSIYTTYGIYYNIPDPDAGTAITVPSTINIGRVSVIPVEGDIALELASGSSEDFKAYNIYDLAGNMWEWTTEESEDNKAAIRGGSFNGSGAQRPIVMMNGDNSASGYYSYNISFRSVLYLK